MTRVRVVLHRVGAIQSSSAWPLGTLLGTGDEFVLQFTCLFGSAPRKHLMLGAQEWNVAGIAIPRFDGPSLSCTVANRYGG